MGYGIINLSLYNFRNYASFNIENINSKCVFIHGRNGIGKTNILEAISLLVSNRGLRNAHLNNYIRQNSDINTWSITAKVNSNNRIIDIATGIESSDTTKKVFYLNGSPLKNQLSILEYLQVITLTPQMDGLFLGSPSDRRGFLDRLISTLDPEHNSRLNSYEKSVRERNNILVENFNEKWLDAVETKIVELGITIASSRMMFLEDLQSFSLLRNSVFPKLEMYQDCILSSWLRDMPSIEAEQKYKKSLSANREQDRISHSTSIGVHRSDFGVKFLKNNMDAADCSTGEQKIIMISLLLAYADLLNNRYKNYPIFLLDEVLVHLDEGYKKALMDELLSFKTQVWISGVSNSIVEEYSSIMQFIKLED